LNIIQNNWTWIKGLTMTEKGKSMTCHCYLTDRQSLTDLKEETQDKRQD